MQVSRLQESLVHEVADALEIPMSRARWLLAESHGNAEEAIRCYRKLTVCLPPPEAAKPQPEDPTIDDAEPEETLGNESEPNADPASVPEADPVEWDFTLPRLPAPEELTNGGEDGSGGFFLEELMAGVQNGESYDRVREYLLFYDRDLVRAHANEKVAGFPAIFYFVERRNLELIRLWTKHGGDVNAKASCGTSKDVPLLAFAVAIGGTYRTDTTELVATLLSLGASVACLPRQLYFPLEQDLRREGPPGEDMAEVTGHVPWCTPTVWAFLACRLNLRQRYFMHLSSLEKPYGVRAKQVTRHKDAENLLGIPYFLIGQTVAAKFLIELLLVQLARKPEAPLVIVFAGPSGHGKTELARSLGKLLSLEMEIVDCTNKSTEREMFGARNPYEGWREGSPLNNFLASQNRTECIVFLDEFEKTTEEVHQTLLLPFQNGQYEDRRSKSPVDCSKSVWILATNAFDHMIHEFCKENDTVLQSEDQAAQAAKQKLVKGLSRKLRVESISKFGAPLTGRITDFVPFLTFSKIEQAAVTHKYLTEVGMRLAKPISMSQDRLVGDIDLQVPKDYSVCRIIAKDYYEQQLGARSVIDGVKHLIDKVVVLEYLQVESMIEEGQAVTAYRAEPTIDDEDIQICRIPTMQQRE